MSLSKYKSKRNLKISREPEVKLKKKTKGDLIFVIQEHHARHLHYDLRLEAQGVLKSWAIPKQPSMDPSTKRLAIQVEDHPYAYKDFEGVIPSGYGAGTVKIWDRGTYHIDGKDAKETEKSILNGLKKGVFHFSLQGKKLKGVFHFIHLKNANKNQWLLIKKKEEKKESEIYRKYLKNREFDKEASQNFDSERMTIAERQGMSENQNFEIKPTRSKTDSSSIFGISVSNLNKIFWPADEMTKGDLMHYYDTVSRWILPYLQDRPVSLKRFPNGIEGISFFQKNIKDPPIWMETKVIKHESKNVNYILIQNTKTLLFLINLACIEIHPFFSRIFKLQFPDYLIFDLDPKGASFNKVIEIARALHSVLEEIGVKSYCKTSGATGLHIAIPLGAKYTFDQAKKFAGLAAFIVHQRLPNISTLQRSLSKREGKVYIDCYQNNFAQTVVAPYSVRARPLAPVSTPLKWEEVKKGLDPRAYTIKTVFRRLKRYGDLYAPVLGKGIDLERALKNIALIF